MRNRVRGFMHRGIASGTIGSDRLSFIMRAIVDHIDHVVLTVADIQRTVDFYTRVLGMEEETFGGGRRALRFGNQKMNLHQWGEEFEPKADRPTPGSVDICLISNMPIGEVARWVKENGVEIVEGPVERRGAMGKIMSVYFRDPDRNLIEVANYLEVGDSAE